MYSKKKVMVVGVGVSGKGAVELLLRKNAKVFVFDDVEEKAKKVSEEYGVHFVSVSEFPSVLSSCDFVILSPGISINSNIAVMAQALGVKVLPEIELGESCCNGTVYAVTGTNGKSSMVRLIGSLLELNGKSVEVCGNIGRSFSSVADKVEEDGFAIVETSSFQLETVMNFKPSLAIIVNVKPDHLDRHLSIEEYVKAKSGIMKNMDEYDVVIGNYDDLSKEIVDNSNCCKYYFSTKRAVPEGVYVDGDEIVAISTGRRYVIGRMSDVKDVKTPLENVVALLCVALVCNVSFGLAYKCLREFEPLPHTMQYVGKKGKIRYVNDSKGTNISATLCAIDNTDGRIALICGGRTKGENYAELFGKLPDRIVSTVCIGENAEELTRLAMSAGIKSTVADSVENAVRRASESVLDGGTVLFSPATASFDAYENYAERGMAFVSAVTAYAHE
ncbi:MAG: UDP-N-acetylmuramoyl-L-alanine--D-glutamate ligase [Clostridia bacterium]|nr:UDP-N-acetylmuramoyl-L-alanine--D-glutamate ligase [Clostridia bacterium]